MLFDVDGTLMDTNYLHSVAWWEAFRQMGHTVATASIHRAIGMGADHLLEHLLGKDRDRDEDAAISTAHQVLYAQYFSRLTPLEGAADLLRECASRGWKVVLASSAQSKELGAMREALGADDAITAVTCADDVKASKPAPDLVETALKRAAVPADRAVFVGDTVWDVQACRHAGVPCLGVLSGGISGAELLGAGATAVYQGPSDLLSHIDDSLLASPGQ
ncbi:MAG: family hydrolase [Streptomyces oryziradicis]|nr:family hydrolase [Actinacidiphila oryziradicis]